MKSIMSGPIPTHPYLTTHLQQPRHRPTGWSNSRIGRAKALACECSNKAQDQMKYSNATWSWKKLVPHFSPFLGGIHVQKTHLAVWSQVSPIWKNWKIGKFLLICHITRSQDNLHWFRGKKKITEWNYNQAGAWFETPLPLLLHPCSFRGATLACA